MAHTLGIIGCGGHAQHHARNLDDDFIVTCAWDPDPAMLDELCAASLHAKPAKSLEEALASDVLAVMICSPDEFHLDQIEKALEAGKHVFCEKPLLTPEQPIEQLEAVFDLAKQKGLVITSCHPRRYDNPILWLTERVSSQIEDAEFLRRFGKVIDFAFDFSYHRPEHEWKHTRSLLLDHVNHEVDLMNAFFGIQGFDAWKLHDSSDHYKVVGRRDDGITFNFQGTRRLEERTYPEWCRVRFERGEIVLDMHAGVAYVSDHETGETEQIKDKQLEISYSERLCRVAYDFAREIDGVTVGYLTRSEMLMNTESGIVLQREGVQRINVRR